MFTTEKLQDKFKKNINTWYYNIFNITITETIIDLIELEKLL